MPVASVTRPETPWGREGWLWRVGSQVWGPTAPLSTPRLLPYPPWPSCARMGVGGQWVLWVCRKATLDRRGLSLPFPLSLSPSVPLFLFPQCYVGSLLRGAG